MAAQQSEPTSETDVEPYREWAVHKDSGVEHLVAQRFAGSTECGEYVNRMRIEKSIWPLTERDIERNNDVCLRCAVTADAAKLRAGYIELHGEPPEADDGEAGD